VNEAPPVHLVHRDYRENAAVPVFQVNKAHLAPLVNKGDAVHLAKRAYLEQLDLGEDLEHKGHKALAVKEVLLAPLVQRVLSVVQENKAYVVSKDNAEKQDYLGLQVNKVDKVNKDREAQQALPVLQVKKDHKEHLEWLVL